MNRATLDQLVADLIAIPSLKTVKVGLERTRTEEDYPLARIVIENVNSTEDYYDSVSEVTIYFAEPIHESEVELIDIYESQLSLNKQIVDIVENSTVYTALWEGTSFDSDLFPEYKVAAAAFTIRVSC